MYLCRNFSILEEMTEDIFGWMLEGILAGISRKKNYGEKAERIFGGISSEVVEEIFEKI